MGSPAVTQATPQAHYELARAADARGDLPAAISEYREAIRLSGPANAQPGTAFFNEDQYTTYGHRAAFNIATKNAEAGLQAFSKMTARQAKGDVLKPTDEDVKAAAFFLGSAEAFYDIATHDAQRKPLNDANGLENLAIVRLQIAQAQAIAPAVVGAKIALPGMTAANHGVPNLSGLPVMRTLAAADAAVTDAAAAGLNPAHVTQLRDMTLATFLNVESAMYAGAMAAISPATNPNALVTTTGQRIPPEQLAAIIKVSAYARIARASIPGQPASAEQFRAMLTSGKHPMTPEEWKNLYKGYWAREVQTIAAGYQKQNRPVPAVITKAVEAGTTLVNNADGFR